MHATDNSRGLRKARDRKAAVSNAYWQKQYGVSITLLLENTRHCTVQYTAQLLQMKSVTWYNAENGNFSRSWGGKVDDKLARRSFAAVLVTSL